MCVAYPGKVISVEGDAAKVDFGGNITDVNLKLVTAETGDYVLVHAGYATVKLNEKDAEGILEAFNEL
jgi:hydrogenase expression/formation protein HypC